MGNGSAKYQNQHKTISEVQMKIKQTEILEAKK